VGLQELSKNGPAELNEDVLSIGQVSGALRLGQDSETDLHPLNVVPVGTQ